MPPDGPSICTSAIAVDEADRVEHGGDRGRAFAGRRAIDPSRFADGDDVDVGLAVRRPRDQQLLERRRDSRPAIRPRATAARSSPSRRRSSVTSDRPTASASTMARRPPAQVTTSAPAVRGPRAMAQLPPMICASSASAVMRPPGPEAQPADAGRRLDDQRRAGIAGGEQAAVDGEPERGHLDHGRRASASPRRRTTAARRGRSARSPRRAARRPGRRGRAARR